MPYQCLRLLAGTGKTAGSSQDTVLFERRRVIAVTVQARRSVVRASRLLSFQTAPVSALP